MKDSSEDKGDGGYGELEGWRPPSITVLEPRSRQSMAYRCRNFPTKGKSQKLSGGRIMSGDRLRGCNDD
jgi:hypothetical protein